MATASEINAAATEPEWETISTSIGEEWDFEQDGVLVGHFLGTKTVESTKVDSGEATAIQFAPLDNPDHVVFIWQSADLMMFSNDDRIRTGDLCKINFLGRRTFTGKDNKPRQIKNYSVQVAKIVPTA